MQTDRRPLAPSPLIQGALTAVFCFLVARSMRFLSQSRKSLRLLAKRRFAKLAPTAAGRLFARASLIPGAGAGLFTRAPIRKGFVIARMRAPREGPGPERRVLHSPALPDTCISVACGPHKGTTVHDSVWPARSKPKWYLINHSPAGNARFELATAPSGELVALWRAKCNIEAGSEITWNYSPGFVTRFY